MRTSTLLSSNLLVNLGWNSTRRQPANEPGQLIQTWTLKAADVLTLALFLRYSVFARRKVVLDLLPGVSALLRGCGQLPYQFKLLPMQLNEL
ncbi:uncharacterized [Tachysurus ichikawai]